jgi:hypothetical protein
MTVYILKPLVVEKLLYLVPVYEVITNCLLYDLSYAVSGLEYLPLNRTGNFITVSEKLAFSP